MTQITRRTAALLALLGPVIAKAAGRGDARSSSATVQPGEGLEMTPRSTGNEKIAIVIYDHMTALDVIGPHYFLARLPGAKVEFVAEQGQKGPQATNVVLAG